MTAPRYRILPLFEGALRAAEWITEFRRRWPAAVGVLRGKTVIYQATLGPPQKHMVLLNNPNGAVVLDTRIDGGGMGAGVEQR